MHSFWLYIQAPHSEKNRTLSKAAICGQKGNELEISSLFIAERRDHLLLKWSPS